MCGILIYQNLRDQGIPESALGALEMMRHRGPDAQNHSIDRGTFLGHTRLKIIDLSDRANQPMISEDGRLELIFNGEVYNFAELRKELEAKGHTFKTSSDTEVLLQAYEAYGASCLEKFNGMFAFAIYDHQDQSVFIARDRLGIKPFYYISEGPSFAGASEIAPLLQLGLVEREVDTVALGQFLLLGAAQAPRTIIQGVQALLPGHFMRVKNGSIDIQKYWETPFVPEREKEQVDREEAVQRTHDLLSDSVRLRTRSDVPVGVFLSGGIDSTAILGLMRSNGTPDLKTFSIGFDVGGGRFNETGVAEKSAAHYGSSHHEFILNADDIVNDLPGFVRSLDQPCRDGLNQYFVSKFAGRDVTVCLSGLGGDEVFGGYGYVKRFMRFNDLGSILPSAFNGFGSFARPLIDQLPLSAHRTRYLRGTLALPPFWKNRHELYLNLSSQFPRGIPKRLLGTPFSPADFADNGIAPTEDISQIDAVAYFDQSVYLRNTLLRDSDVMSMAHSIELRVPFLDHRLVEYVAGLPQDVKWKRGRSKDLLKSAVQEGFPDEVMNRKKMGFTFPINLWFNEPRLNEIMLDCLSPSGLPARDFMNTKETEGLLGELLSSDYAGPQSHHGGNIWKLMILELWLRETIDKEQSKSSTPVPELTSAPESASTNASGESSTPHPEKNEGLN